MPDDEKILLMGFAGLGDTLLFTPALTLLREKMPEARITALLVTGSQREVLSTNPSVDEIVFAGKIWRNPIMFVRTLIGLRRKGFDAVLTVYPTSRIIYNLISFASGAKKRISHDYPGDNIRKLGFLQNARVPIAAGEHNVVQNINLVKALGVRAGEHPLQIVFNADEGAASRVKEFLSQSGLKDSDYVVGIHPGSGGMSYKRWPLKNFIQLAERLTSDSNKKVIFFIGPQEKDLAEKIRNSGFPVFDGGSLSETASLIGACNVFVSNDSALMHVAASQGVPVAGIFGPTDPAKTGPYTGKKVEVKSTLSCSPCYSPSAHRKFRCVFKESRCLTKVSVEEVLKAVGELSNNL